MDQVYTGTTIVAIKTSQTLIVGADTRTSSGAFIPSRYTNKLSLIYKNIFCLRSGSAADTQKVADEAQKQLTKYEYMYKQKITVKLAAKICQTICYENEDLLYGLIVCGKDDSGYHIFTINLGGSLVENDYALSGSGSIFLYSVFDEKFRNDFSVEEGFMFVKDVVSKAIKRDNYSGGCVRLAIVDDEGVKRFFVPGNEIQ